MRLLLLAHHNLTNQCAHFRVESPMKCYACNSSMQSLGQLPIRTGGIKGGWHLLLGEWADMTEGVLPLDVYRCPQCKRIEFFDLDLSLPEHTRGRT